MLFKDEVRRIGESLEIDSNILNRHPFPGPGLGIRILGEVDQESIRLVQEADKIIVLDKGTSCETGNHDQLIQKKGRYRELCEKQFIRAIK